MEKVTSTGKAYNYSLKVVYESHDNAIEYLYFCGTVS